MLAKLTKKNDHVRFVYVARRIPSTLASSVMDELKKHEYVGVDTRPDPLRTYPAGDVAANLIGFLGDDGKPLAGLELQLRQAAGRQGRQGDLRGRRRQPDPARRQQPGQAGQRQGPAADHRPRRAVVQPSACCARRCSRRKARSGAAVVLDSRTGEILALADYPTFDANKPGKAAKEDLGSRALSDVYEPGLGGEGAHRRRRCSTPARSPRGPGSRCPPSCRCSTASSATGSTTA